MGTNWRSQSGFCKSVFEDFINMGNPIPESEKVNAICPSCQYHTAWKRAEDWIVCGWCADYVGNGAEKRKAEAARYINIAAIKKAIADAEKQGVNLNNKIQATVRQCGDRDGRAYQNWELLPDADHSRMFAKIQELIKPKVAIASKENY